MRNLILLVIFITVSLFTLADNKGFTHYKKGEYSKALKIWTEEADNGEANAIYNIGLLYFFGNGVNKDLSIAYNFCKKAALKGLARAQNNLAYMYLNGMGTNKDYVNSYAWSLIAIKHGYNSQGIKDNAKMHLTPAMLTDAERLANKMIKEIKK
jgi:TPR repeat protein